MFRGQVDINFWTLMPDKVGTISKDQFSNLGSPLTDQEATHTEHELTVKAKADDLIDQVHSIISGCLSKANEIEDIERMKKEMEAWIDNKENEVAKQLQKPSKLRPDAAQLEINLISDFRQTVAEKHGVLEQLDQRLRDAGVQDPSSMEIRIKLDVLDEHVGNFNDSFPNQIWSL